MLLRIYDVVIQKTMSPRKSEEDVMIKSCQKQSFADIPQNIFCKTPVLESFFNKV